MWRFIPTLFLFLSIFLHVAEVHAITVGDMNGDDLLTAADRELFALALIDPEQYQAFTGRDPNVVGDVNQDGVHNTLDIFPFGHLLGMSDDEIFSYIEGLTGRPSGDANQDGCVDLSDFGILKSNFGRQEVPLEGDLNFDGKVDLSDFGILKANFGRCL